MSRMYSKLTSNDSVWWMVMYEIGHRSAGKMMWRTIARAPAPSARAAWNRCSGMARIADVKMIMPSDAPMNPFATTMTRSGRLLRRSIGAMSSAWTRIWFSRPRSFGSTTHSHRSAYTTDGLIRGRSQTARKNAPMPRGTAVVVSASSSAKVTLKMPSVETTKMAVIPREARSRESRVTMRSKLSRVSFETASVRSMSVKARTRSTTTGATKKQARSRSAGPRKTAKLARWRRSWACAKSGTSVPPLIPDHDVLAELVLQLADYEVRRGLCAEPAGLQTLDALEHDGVVLADLRVIGHEARVLEHWRRGRESPALFEDLGHRLLAVVD